MARRLLTGIGIPILALFSALLLGSFVILSTGGGWDKVLTAYGAVVYGAFLKPRGFSETLLAMTPLILTGLAVALAFKAGLFNIGGEGQFLIGSLCSVWIGYHLTGLPGIVLVPLGLIAGMLGGAFWAAIAGYLKSRLGSHEVINTIMLNYIAFNLGDFLVNSRGPMNDPTSSVPRSPMIALSAHLPRLNPGSPSDRLHAGVIIALLATAVIWWLLYKTTLGFELRTTGANPDAARYAGMNARRNLVLAMALSGSLAGLAGAVEVQGLNFNVPAAVQSFSAGYGFDAIAVALLGHNHPFGVVPGAFLFGAMRTGADLLQLRTGVSRYVISIIQALVLLFAAAPAIVRWIYRIRAERRVEEAPLTRGWGA
ncbi:MAG: ABC transporter permease [Anaerolineae bacterium]|nr:ABC transporter permease [Anaerolineae bacterium]